LDWVTPYLAFWWKTILEIYCRFAVAFAYGGNFSHSRMANGQSVALVSGLGLSVTACVRRAARNRATFCGVVDGMQRFTWREHAERVARLAGCQRWLGLFEQFWCVS
jgi:hypothetical protein